MPAAVPSPAAASSAEPLRHPLHEDVQALLTGAAVAAFGILLFRQAGLVPGGTVGLALLLHYASGLDLSLALLLANAPFFVLAWLRVGREFALKTVAAVALAAVITRALPLGLTIGHLTPLVGALLGGLLSGIGVLVLFRHRAGLGGLNVVAFYAQERWGWKAGQVQLALDAVIVVAGGVLAADWARLAYSILAVVTLNLVLAVNHRPDRYRPLGA